MNQTITDMLPEVRIIKVQVDIPRSSWDIHLITDNPLSKQRLDSLEEYLLNKVPELKKINFLFIEPLTEEQVAKCLEKNWSELLDKFISEVPAVNGWLTDCSKKYEANTVIITVKDQLGIKILEERKFNLLLSKSLAKYIGFQPKVSFECHLGEKRNTQPEWQQLAEQQFIKQINEKKSITKDTDNKKSSKNKSCICVGRTIKDDAVPISSVQEEERQVIVVGRVFDKDLRELRSGRNLLSFNITDNTDSISVKCFLEKDNIETISDVNEGCWVKVRGPVQHDKYSRELTLMANDINFIDVCPRADTAKEKRVELHLHTKMSAMDSVLNVSDAVKQAAKWGHCALAITDHGVIQSFPDAYNAGEKYGIKVIYGLEGYLINDGIPVVENPVDAYLSKSDFVVFDIETTGFHPRTDDILEIGAVKVRGNELVDSFFTTVRPKKPIPLEVIKLTGISDDMVKDAPVVQEALEKFKAFIGNSVLVAHNAAFDVGFIRMNMAKNLNVNLENPVIDTVSMGRALFPDLKNYKLKTLCAEFNIPLENHHRAVDDAQATAQLFEIFINHCIEKGIKTVAELNKLTVKGNLEKVRPNHITILAQTQKGLNNLYRLVSLSHLDYYHRHPRIPKSKLSCFREGLLIGSACDRGELFEAILAGASQDKIESIAGFYDYIEIQPLGNSRFLIESGRLKNIDQLKEIYVNLIQLGKKLGKPVVATGDVHFLDPEDEIFRRILMSGQGFDDADKQPPLYFKTTDEMLREFSYLDEKTAYEVVVENSRLIAEGIEKILPIPKETYPPKIEGAEEQIKVMAERKAEEWFGSPMPELVRARLDKELNSIIGNGYAVLYLTSQKLVKKSNDDGYLVGSRGSVGSSLVATLTGITEVNPLPPHYRCPNCKNCEFIQDGSYGCGADLPDKQCVKCSELMVKDGHDIPFEVFMGFEGDKVPDIDLNFSGEYQSRAHRYTEELFGKENVFKAGTIGTIAEKTAYGFVKKYLDEKGLMKREAEINRLVVGCTGVKRTTGQHPGGLMVVPKEVDVYNITPLQHPADDKKSGIITTHFDYHSIHDCLVKLDILGHDDPTVIKMLEDITGVNARNISLDDEKTLSLFSGTTALGVQPEQIRSQIGSYAIPEFGTKFVRQMLMDTKPSTFSELVRISGFSHGTDVWLNNAQDLIKEGICQLSEAISARDDIMVYLIYKGLPQKQAFKIMEKVRKGKGVSEEDAQDMISHGVPQWYIESCRKIKYMFPKAHAVAYVMMAFRIAWFKVNYPEAFYATYFTVRADDFDADIMVGGAHAILQVIEEIEGKGVSASQKEKNMLTILEVALEMYARGIVFNRVSLLDSDATNFIINGKQILPPLVALQGLGENAARSIVKAREEAPFTSIEDLRNRAKVSKTIIEILQSHGCLQGMEQTDQLSLFI